MRDMEGILRKDPASILFVGPQNFEKEVIQESRPVLLLCTQRDSDFNKQIEVMETVHSAFSEKLKACLLEQDFVEVFMEMYDIKGTPTFVMFTGGREKARLLGQIAPETLRNFVLRVLSAEQRDD
ncbi:MAG: hypothetical protein JRH08_14930 [Deltaproteobacteria bacterium]|nr:hypothetical protein [Deltaproteobacteria bacterium]MBW1930990.1 hypothetical protein [Deltaproteobacteria bacterium]MBW2026464.1 hypothetical protein [Deltaproteobacteria bacterium]MBW2126928.1 hypothetical protein [Deltaproteobacteria bacterium]